MTPPIHDREQAIEVVLAITFNNPVPGIKDALGARKRKEAEWIVDALGIGQPDPEVERVDGVRWFTELLVREQVKVVLERAERAEERLRVTDEMTDKVHSRLYPHDPESPDWANRKEWWRWKDVQAALRAVLSVGQESSGTQD